MSLALQVFTQFSSFLSVHCRKPLISTCQYTQRGMSSKEVYDTGLWATCPCNLRLPGLLWLILKVTTQLYAGLLLIIHGHFIYCIHQQLCHDGCFSYKGLRCPIISKFLVSCRVNEILKDSFQVIICSLLQKA